MSRNFLIHQVLAPVLLIAGLLVCWAFVSAVVRQVLKLRVEKKGYSASPWRLVNEEGRELYDWVAYPGDPKMAPYRGPVCFDRKRDAVAKLAELIDTGLVEALQVAFPEEVGAAGTTCGECARVLVLEVLYSAAGYYVGTRCKCGPYSRESGYYRTKGAAELDLRSGLFGRLT